MDPSVYKLFRILKFMKDQKYRGEKISKLTLVEFCEKMLATSISSVTFAAMYDACYKFKEISTQRRDFYQLTRDIDDIIMSIVGTDIRFKKYDERLEFIMKEGSSTYRNLCKEYRQETCDIFNLDNIKEAKPLYNKLQIPQKFDIANLVV